MGGENIIKEAYEIIRAPYDGLTSNPHSHRRYFGYNCIYVPEEMLHAAGFIPIRLFGSTAGINTAEKYIPSHCCDFIKNMLSAFDRGTYGFMEGVVFGFCCDTMQVASNIVMERRHAKVLHVNIPTKLTGELTRRYLVAELQRFKKNLEDRFNVKIDEDRLNESLDVYRENNRLMLEVKAHKANHSDSISGADYLALLSMGYFIPRQDHNERLKFFIDNPETESAGSGKTGKKVIVAGYVHNNFELLNQIEALGVAIIDDDLCEGSRYLTSGAEFGQSPVHTVADRILSRYCPVKQASGEDFADVLIKKYTEASAGGIIIFLLRFCDPQSMEYAATRYKLEAENIPFVVIEPPVHGGLSGQIETRLEAFIERI